MVSLRAVTFMAAVSLCAADFGYTTTDDYYTIDTDAGLVFTVRRNMYSVSLWSVGDLGAIIYKGQDLSVPTKGSHVNSGFDFLYEYTSDVSLDIGMVGNDAIKVTVTAGNLTQYYMARRGESRIYLANYFTVEPPINNHVRFIFRLNSSVLPFGPTDSDIRGNIGFVESKDIFLMPNGETRSKHYSNNRLKDWSYIGAGGDGVGAWVVRGNQEGGAGGPFWRSLLNQGTDETQEITYNQHYSHAQTEEFRLGVLNDFTMVVNDGEDPIPSDIETSPAWFSEMGLLGYIPPSERGGAKGSIANQKADKAYTVGFKNSKSQYWADTFNSEFEATNMMEGEYLVTVYRGELEVYMQEGVVITAGTTLNLGSITIESDPNDAVVMWRIGEWNGQPTELLNGDLVTDMHPSDVRMAEWNIQNFYVGVDTSSQFPAYMWKDVNSGLAIHFSLTEAEAAIGHQVRIGITIAYKEGVPTIAVNGWTGEQPTATGQPDTRSITTGSYRGNNAVFSWNVPATAFVVGDNVMTVSVASGRGDVSFLSAGISLDCIEFHASALTLPPTPAPTPAPTPVPMTNPPGSFADGMYTIYNVEFGMNMDIVNSSTENSASVELRRASVYNSQKWEVIGIGKDFYKIINVHSGLALDVYGKSKSDGADIDQYTYKDQNNQMWRIEEAETGFFIMSRRSHFYIDVDIDSVPSVTTQGANVWQWRKVEGRATQIWTFNPTTRFSSNSTTLLFWSNLLFGRPLKRGLPKSTREVLRLRPSLVVRVTSTW
ncbi:putative rhamnogalacturonase [Diplonema papillatum]|nr:putative rhamnogalacturonase [Diplonema papillatum]